MDKTLTTRGTGKASGTPDAMRLSVGVVVRAPSVSAALAGTASGVEALGEAARRFTTDEHITSTGLNVWPAYDNDGRPAGYEARHSVSVYCTELGLAGELVTAIGDLEGRVLVEGIEPVVADPEPLSVRAREGAWIDARRKADELAALAGVTVGEVIAIAEGGPSYEPMAVAMDVASTKFEPGSQSVTAVLTVTWGLI